MKFNLAVRPLRLMKGIYYMFNLDNQEFHNLKTPKIIPFPFNFAPHHTFDIPNVSVIVPAMNEAKNLPHVLPYIPGWVHEIILVDGNSKDDTVAVAKQLCPDKLRVITQSGKGKGTALRMDSQPRQVTSL
jgi:cellulose synthase/poly-beta-1,6-N-acetylglucosamine synthase-like glycosyltransferase